MTDEQLEQILSELRGMNEKLESVLEFQQSHDSSASIEEIRGTLHEFSGNYEQAVGASLSEGTPGETPADTTALIESIVGDMAGISDDLSSISEQQVTTVQYDGYMEVSNSLMLALILSVLLLTGIILANAVWRKF